MKTRRRSRGQRGSSLIEGALSFSAFLLLTFGVMEFSLAVFASNFCAYAAREATRWASVRGSTSSSPVAATDVQSYVQRQAVGLVSSRLNVTTTWAPDNKPGSIVRVNVNYNVVPLAGLAINSSTVVGSTSQMTIVQ